MVRLLIEDVTLTKEAAVKVQIRFKGGASRELTLSRPRNAWQRRQTNPEVIKQIDHLLDRHTDGETAAELNRRGFRSGAGLSFDGRVVAQLRRAYHLKSRYDRLRQMGKLTQEEMAERLDVSTATIRQWRQYGLVIGHAYNDKHECLYDHPRGNVPRKAKGKKLSQRVSSSAVDANSTNEVHHAT
jgi:hypothetical protein